MKKTSHPAHRHMPRHQGWAAAAAFLATMLAWPASADFDIPDNPLTTGARVPPNILFILDDSGSMAFDYMPDALENTNNSGGQYYCGTDFRCMTYAHNTLYYNPATDYQPWIGAAGSPLTGGTSYSAVYGDFNNASGNTIDLSNPSSCRTYNYNDNATSSEVWNGREVCGGVQTFYVPKDEDNSDSGYLSNLSNYFRYQILTSGVVQRSEWGPVTSSNSNVPGYPITGISGSAGTWRHYTVAVPADVTLTVSISGGSGDADLYLRYGSQPTLSAYSCRPWVNGNNETCTVNSTTAGNYYIGIHSYTANNNVTLSVTTSSSNRCGSGAGSPSWINCTEATPTGRSAAEERTNYATWFSYHRTRMKAAKAGASTAFRELGGEVRVGFRTIWERNGSQTNLNWPRQSRPIPVGYNDGLFTNTVVDGVSFDNRTKWYSRLHGAIGYNGTPLHGALHEAGQYFSDSSANGPYGPLSGSDQLACRQNFAILTTDGYWNSESNYNSSGIGNSDNTDGDSITHGLTGQTYQYSAASPYQDSYSNTLADVAMHYWKTDLRDDLSNIVPSSTANPAFWQHMVTFGISIGLEGTLDPTTHTPGTWPDPWRRGGAGSTSGWAQDGPRRIDDLWHAAINSRGRFVAATDPEEFANGLQTALAAIVERTGSFSNVAANSTAIDTGARVYQANYTSNVWVGELRSQPVTASGVEEVDCSESDQPSNGWCASKGIPSTGRKVFTSNGHNNGSIAAPVVTNGTAGLEFPAQATAAQLASLERLGPTLSYPVSGENNAAYVAGDRSLELFNDGQLRNRNHLLGDIVGSSPAYVRETNTIYVGANDGMLHAINAANGNELFAFVPGIVNWADLSTLSRPDYAHRYFVDGPVVVTSTQQTPGENILVGALGKGGKGMFSLDVSSPATFSAANFKWERADTPLGNMGLVQGRPIITKVSDGTDAVIIGNGVNSTNNRAVLIVMDLDTGQVIREIDTGVGSAALPNGLSAPAGVLGPDGRTLAYVYAGDMLGNVWKFDLTHEASADWSVRKLFEAGESRPISGAVTISTHPLTNQRWVFFGTGRYLTSADVADTTPQGMYGFVEDAETLDPSDLTLRTVTVTVPADDNNPPRRAFEESTPLPPTSKGWYIDLPESGERIVQDAQVVSTFLVTASMIPTGDGCQSDGSGYINALDAFTGTSAGGSYFDLDRDGSTTDELIGDVPVGSINVGVGMPTLPNLLRGMVVVGGSAGSDVGSPSTLSPRWDRASWREIRGE